MNKSNLANEIHPTAIIGSKVRLGIGNKIGPNCIIEGDIQIGDKNVFESNVHLVNKISIGYGNHVFPFVAIGYQGEMGSKGDIIPKNGIVNIGNKNIIREFVNIHFPVYRSATIIGDRNYLMNKAYIAHDVIIGDGVTITAGAKLGGRVEIGSCANIGLGATIHQRVRIGQYAMIGMNAVVNKDVLPFSTIVGSPGRVIGFNEIAAKKADFSESSIEECKGQFFNVIGGSEYPANNRLINIIDEFKAINPNFLQKRYKSI